MKVTKKPTLAVGRLASLASLAACVSFGCSPSTQAPPKLVSSTHHESYAEDFPKALESHAKATGDREAKTRAIVQQMPEYTKRLRGADAARVLAILDAADESGRSAGYVARSRENAAVAGFLDDDRDGVARRIAGATKAKIKEKEPQCEADVGGTVSYALKDGVDRQLERRLRDRNQGQAILEHSAKAIGPDNVADLEKQADAIAYASYSVYVGLPDDRSRLSAMLAERSDVATTIDRNLEEERAFAAEKGRTDAERQASSERTAALMKGKASLKAFSGDAEARERSLGEEIPRLQKAYEDALRTIRAQLTPAR